MPSRLAFASLIALVCAANLAANMDFRAPPRFDGAGYAVLARSIGSGRGYREIDHPDAPRHAHFPPGYPLVLAAIWSVTGPSAAAAHAFSMACTIVATLLAWLGFRSWQKPGIALLMGLALAVNWRWGRDGSAIQSEPMFAMLGLGAWLVSQRTARRGGWPIGVLLGVLLGMTTLTRHVGIALAAAVIADLGIGGRRREAMATTVTLMIVLAPWIAWLAVVRTHTQVGLVPMRGLAGVMAENGLFYTRRLIDQVVGPVVEVFTVFRPRYSGWATAGSVIASAVIVLGWFRLVRSRESRSAGMIPMMTLAILLAWPFTEAGRFLVPLIPFLIAGLCEGVAAILEAAGFRGREDSEAGSFSLRSLAAALVLAASIPFSLYAALYHRAEAGRRTNDGFDSACAWIARQAEPPGPVLTRHPGEVFWLTGRRAITPPDEATAEDVAALAARYRTVFLLIDDDRFARAPKSPLGRYERAFPDRVERVFDSAGDRPVVVDRLKNPD
jgi:hypothetical protein